MDRALTKWKPFGYVIGCIGIAINLLHFNIFDGKFSNDFISILYSCIKIGLNLIYIEGFEKKTVDDYKHIPLAINLIVSIIWLVGIYLNKPNLLLPLLLWFTLMSAVWVIIAVIYVVARVRNSIDNEETRDNGGGIVYLIIHDAATIVISVIVVLVCTSTVICYFGLRDAIKRYRLGNPRTDVEYTPAPTENQLYPNIK